MWIVASSPFWVVGLGLLFFGSYGAYRCFRFRADKTANDLWETIIGCGAILIGSGIFLVVAAKIVS